MGRYLYAEGALSFLVRGAWLGMRAAIGAELKELGLTTPQYATLMIVQDHPGLSNSDVGRKVSSSRQAANEMLAGLERAGLIVRRPHPGDRRTQQIEITEAGSALLERARVTVARREAELEAGLGPDQRAAVRAWLETISDLCAEEPPN